MNFLLEKKKSQAFLYIISLDKFRNCKRLYSTGDLCYAVCAYFGTYFVHKIVPHWRKEKENPLEFSYLYDFHVEIKKMKDNKD